MSALKLACLGVILAALVNPSLGAAPAPEPTPPAGVTRPRTHAEEQAAAYEAMVRALLKALKDPDEKVRIYAGSALCTLDVVAVPALLDVLDGKDKALRARAATILGHMGTHGRRHQTALPALTRALDDDDVEVRRAAAYAISQIVVSP